MLTTDLKTVSGQKLGNSLANQKCLRWLCAFLFCSYIVFCPAVNEPLYQLLAVLPSREVVDLKAPVKMGAYTGEHCFFPVKLPLGARERPDGPYLLHGVYFAAKNASGICSKTPNKGIVIVNPGNSFCLTHMIGCKPFTTILDLGFDLFVYDYEGFGESEGRADYRKLGNDALSAYQYIHDRAPKSPIILYGMSMGTGVTSYVAEREPVSAIVLDSPFISPERTLKDWFSILNIYPSQMFPEPRYDNARYLTGKHPPTLLLTKGCDAICWPTQGAELARLASPPTTAIVLPHSQHLYVDSQDEALYISGLKKFLQSF